MENNRTLDKLDKYLISLCKKHKGNYMHSKNSSYYEINGRVIRVSDHIGKNSSGLIHFILSDDNYLLYYATTQKLRVMDYESVKAFCKSVAFLSPMLNELSSNTFVFEMDKDKNIDKLNSTIRNLKKEKTHLEQTLALRKKELSETKDKYSKIINDRDNAIHYLKETIKTLTEDKDGDFATFVALLDKYCPTKKSSVLNHINSQTDTTKVA